MGEMLRRAGISRRGFIKYCTAMASVMALPPSMGTAMAEQLRQAPRPSVIYLSFQECTGCFESLTRSFAPTIESLIFNVISLDYDDTLMAAAGEAAQSALTKAMHDNFGKYVLVIDGSVPTGAGEPIAPPAVAVRSTPCAKRPRGPRLSCASEPAQRLAAFRSPTQILPKRGP